MLKQSVGHLYFFCLGFDNIGARVNLGGSGMYFGKWGNSLCATDFRLLVEVLDSGLDIVGF